MWASGSQSMGPRRFASDHLSASSAGKRTYSGLGTAAGTSRGACGAQGKQRLPSPGRPARQRALAQQDAPPTSHLRHVAVGSALKEPRASKSP